MFLVPLTIQEIMEMIHSLSLEEQRKAPIHMDDMLQQCANQFVQVHHIWKGERSLRGGSWSSKARLIRDSGRRDIYKMINRYEKSYRKVRFHFGEEEDYVEHWSICLELFQLLEAESQLYRSFVPHETTVINVVSVDTKRGYKLIQLCHANVVDIPADVLALSCSNKPKTAPSGFLISKLKNQYGYTSTLDNPFLHFSPTEWTNVQEGNDSTSFRTLLQICLDGPVDGESFQEYMSRITKGVFASVSALEIMGKSTQVLALPVLQAHRTSIESDYKALIKILLEASIHWVKTSDTTDVINLCVYFGDEIPIWNEAMDAVLGRTIVSANADNAIHMFVMRVLQECEVHTIGPIEESVNAVKTMLSNADNLGVEHIAIYARKLVEAICREVLILHERKTSGDLLSCIERLRKGGIAAPWILSYMHNIRILGNENVHIRAEGREYIPNVMGTNDVISLLSSIQAILQYWTEIRKSFIVQ